MAAEKPEVLIRIEHTEDELKPLREHFTVHYAPSAEEFAAAVAKVGANVRGVITNGTFGIPGDQIRAMPKLEMIQTRGVGYDKVDVDAAKAAGVILANGAGINSEAVADQAMALLLSLVRRIPFDDRAIREGHWTETRGMRPMLHGKRIGILGLGGVGAAIARRAEGFSMKIAYHSRTRKDVPYPFYESIPAIAADSDFLVIALPGGPATREAINAEVLKALGPQGWLVNVGRGSIIDNPALIAALHAGTIAGAATDVIETEPVMPDGLLDAPNFIITPHTGGLAPEIWVLANRLVMNNLVAHFAGKPVVNRVF